MSAPERQAPQPTTLRRTPPKIPRPAPAPIAASPAIGRLREQLAAGADPAATGERFWSEVAAVTPLVEAVDVVEAVAEASASPLAEHIVTFLWRDADAAEVLLFANRLTDERRIDDSLLQRVPGTDVWHLSYRMAADWRASYAFLVRAAGERAPWRAGDDQVALRQALDRGERDPRNPVASRNRAGVEQSVVALPAAPPQPWLAARPGAPAGTVAERTGPGDRRLWVYEPAGATAETELPVVLVLDGEVWRDLLPVTVDGLVAAERMRPARLVLVYSGGVAQRWRDLDADGDGADWLADRLVPWVRTRFATAPGAAAVTVVGQSLGGYTALRVALERPDDVGAALAQSASTWQGDLVASARARDRSGIRVWLEVGSQEWVIRDGHRELAEALAAAGASVTFGEFNGGHDYACWRGGLAEGLAALLPPS